MVRVWILTSNFLHCRQMLDTHLLGVKMYSSLWSVCGFEPSTFFTANQHTCRIPICCAVRNHFHISALKVESNHQPSALQTNRSDCSLTMPSALVRRAFCVIVPLILSYRVTNLLSEQSSVNAIQGRHAFLLQPVREGLHCCPVARHLGVILHQQTGDLVK